MKPVGADSVQLSYYEDDTLWTPRRGHLRRYRGCYYLSTPAPDEAQLWQVQRLQLAAGRYRLQDVRPDTLRLRALPPAAWHQRPDAGRVLITLTPAPGPATRALHQYAGLWRPE